MKSATLAADSIAPLQGLEPSKGRVVDDMAMIRAAAELTRDLNAPNPAIYWADFLTFAILGYAGLFLALGAAQPMAVLGWSIMAVIGLYRAGLFIHELTHLKRSALPGFRFAWNLLIGVPLLVPSFMYEGIHNLHHARTRYGTADDPEYLPLALMKPWTVPVFVLVAVLGPIVLLVRFAVLTPLSLVIPRLRTQVVERFSGLIINPVFRRRPPEGDARRDWFLMETACCLWAIGLLASVFYGLVPLRGFMLFLAVLSGVVVLNQIRTLVAHLWENEGDVMSVTAQFLDSVNVPPPGLLPALWAPVGLRYHALHHLLPGLPYHALGEAHRRLSAALAPESAYHRASHDGLPGLVIRLVGNTAKRD